MGSQGSHPEASQGHASAKNQCPDAHDGPLDGLRGKSWDQALVFGGGMPLGSLWMGALASHTNNSGLALQASGVFCALGAFLIYYFGMKKRRSLN